MPTKIPQITPDSDLKHDTDAAIDFLKHYLPKGRWALTSIPPDKGTTTRTFGPDTEAECRKWIDVRQCKQNIYFHANVIRVESIDNKANKSEIGWLRTLHVDDDPRQGEPLAKERKRILAKALAYEPKPSLVINSGGGYQSFWLMAEPVKIEGNPEHFEAYNKQLEIEFAADHCHNIDRIMRLPGTINMPNKKKRDKGRKPALASIVFVDWDLVYTLDDFTPAATVAQKDSTAKVSISGNLPSIDVNELDVSNTIKMIILHGDDPDDPKYAGDRSKAVWRVVCEMAKAKIDDDTIAAVLLDRDLEISKHIYAQRRPEKYVERQIARGREAVSNEPVRLDRQDPMASATVFVKKFHRHGQSGTCLLVHSNSDFLAWESSSCYAEVEPATMRADVYRFLESAKVPDSEGNLWPFKPNQTLVNHAVDALKATVHARIRDLEPPAWREVQEGMPPADEFLSCRNGLLHLPTGKLYPKNPEFFTRNALPYDFDPDAEKPECWLNFLDQLWGSDNQSIETLQEIFGLMLTPDTRHQKIFMFVGPKRSGKGTIARVLSELVGKANVCAPTLASMSGPFGLQPLIGKQVATISDMRVGKRTDAAIVAERLLSISGEDAITVDRKQTTSWTGKLGVRFLVLTNELPAIADVSGALASRFIIVKLTKSFYGKEDLTLTDKLLDELPGILIWAYEGWQRLNDRGNFVEPLASVDLKKDLENLGSPVAAFLDEMCEIGDGKKEVLIDDLFRAWDSWCLGQGIKYPGTKATFGKGLSAVLPTVTTKKGRRGDARVKIYVGLRLVDDPNSTGEGGSDVPF